MFSGYGAPGIWNQWERSHFPSLASPSSGLFTARCSLCTFMPRLYARQHFKSNSLLSCLLQPDVLVWWPPPLHGQQRGHGDGVVSTGPAAHEAAHVLLLPEQLCCRMSVCVMFAPVHFSARGPPLLLLLLLSALTERRTCQHVLKLSEPSLTFK